MYFRKWFTWSTKHDDLMLREVLASEIWSTRAGSLERGEKWKLIAEKLNNVENPKFGTNSRAVRERFQVLFDKRKVKNREEERARGISPEVTEIDKVLDELIEMFESAAIEQKAAAKDKADKIASDVEKGQEMRRLSMERMNKSAKRKSGSECGSGREKRKNIGVETAQYLNEKLKFDMEWRRTAQKLKAQELEERAKDREAAEQERKRQEENEERNTVRMLEGMKEQLEQQNKLLIHLFQQQQHQNNLIMNLIQQINKKD